MQYSFNDNWQTEWKDRQRDGQTDTWQNVVILQGWQNKQPLEHHSQKADSQTVCT